jgi:hypothetical protein
MADLERVESVDQFVKVVSARSRKWQGTWDRAHGVGLAAGGSEARKTPIGMTPRAPVLQFPSLFDNAPTTGTCQGP